MNEGYFKKNFLLFSLGAFFSVLFLYYSVASSSRLDCPNGFAPGEDFCITESGNDISVGSWTEAVQYCLNEKNSRLCSYGELQSAGKDGWVDDILNIAGDSSGSYEALFIDNSDTVYCCYNK